MASIDARHEKVLTQLYDKLDTLQPGTDEYDKVLSEIMKARSGENESKKIEAEDKAAKKDLWLKGAMFVGGLVITPVIDIVCKKSLAKYIGTIEQMEFFTSSAGRSIGSWFRFK